MQMMYFDKIACIIITQRIILYVGCIFKSCSRFSMLNAIVIDIYEFGGGLMLFRLRVYMLPRMMAGIEMIKVRTGGFNWIVGVVEARSNEEVIKQLSL